MRPGGLLLPRLRQLRPCPAIGAKHPGRHVVHMEPAAGIGRNRIQPQVQPRAQAQAPAPKAAQAPAPKAEPIAAFAAWNT